MTINKPRFAAEADSTLSKIIVLKEQLKDFLGHGLVHYASTMNEMCPCSPEEIIESWNAMDDAERADWELEAQALQGEEG